MIPSLFLGALSLAAASRSVELTNSMTASKAVELGLISAFDNDNVTHTDSFAEVQQHLQEETQGKSAKCPEVQICTTSDGACDPKNLVVITCISAHNLPSQWGDKVDPYVKFWVDNKDNKASTVSYDNNENPSYHFGCPFSYEDTNGDGVFEIVVNLFKNGSPVGGSSGQSTVRFKFQLIKAEGYQLRRR
ncbi:unnamed protein product [Effrenium voratum]|uniref:C2 domain-containing protein n=1 Tax=Effrenium voratum TaxID=2562239 RepID=A0AA36N3H3_9DINO|nr:unnamed protein product [Effrenium voratum]